MPGGADELFPALPAKPLANAITKLIRAHAVRGNVKGEWSSLVSAKGLPVDPFKGCAGAVCARLGIVERRYYEWREEVCRTVTFDVADRILSRGGLLWFEVWPDNPDAEFAFTGEVRDAA